MADNRSFPRLVYEFPFDDAAAYDAEARGYLSHVAVEFETGARISVVFYDPERLQQDLEVETAAGRPFISEPGMIVVPQVKLSNMEAAIVTLSAQGYFEAFKHL